MAAHSLHMYTDLAWAWPLISPPEEYIEEAQDLYQLIQRQIQRPAHTLLHLGCGGGHIDHTLKQYLQITGADITPEMLALARHLNPEIEYLTGDMRYLRLGRVFDAVLIADSIAYMLSEAELRQAFDTAYVHLAEGGVFCTYVEATPDRLVQNQTFCSTHQGPGVEIAFLRNDYDPDPNDTIYENTFVYLIRREGQQEIVTDHHLAGLFPLDTWKRLLTETGFTAVALDKTSYGDPAFLCVR